MRRRWSSSTSISGGTGDDDNESIDDNTLDNHDSISIFDEEGENMAEMNMSASRRVALESRGSFVVDQQMRLSRDLEEGFMDDSDDDDDDGDGHHIKGQRRR